MLLWESKKQVWLIKYIGHCEEIQRLKFTALALCQSESVKLLTQLKQLNKFF